MDLSGLRVALGFRLRGEAVTRLETFVDAAFAFAVTLLVVSFDAMPTSFAELYEALRRLPAFLAGFAILAMFWHSHYRFSRRFGLEDGTVVTLSMALVAATLFYVYPLRMVMSAAMHHLTGGWAPSEFGVGSFTEFRLIFVIYGVGFAALAGLVALLNARALACAGALRLDAVERALARYEVHTHAVLAATAALSIAIAALMPPMDGWAQALPGVVYALPGIAIHRLGVRLTRRVAALGEAQPA